MAAKSGVKRTLTDADVFCHICKGILIEPVTVPCTHVFCMSCFEDSLQETSYSCPLCRKRISNWLRSAKKENKLLDYDLWEQIKAQYKDEVTCKLSGKDDGLDERLQHQFRGTTIITPTGEIGKEFVNIYENFQKQIREEREKQERASMELIERLQRENEEEQLAQSENLKEMLRLQEIENKKPSVKTNNKISPKSSSSSSKKSASKTKGKNSTIPKEEKKRIIGPMDYHIKRLSLAEGRPKKPGTKRPTASCLSSDSYDSISPEINHFHFEPIRIVPKTPPKRTHDGKLIVVTVKKITPRKICTDSSMDLTDSCATMQSPRKLFTDINSSKDHCVVFQSPTSAFKGKLDYLATTEDIGNIADSGVLKEINLDENNDSNSVGIGKADTDIDDPIAVKIPKLGGSLSDTENLSALEEHFDPEEQLKLEERILQEKADHALALKLSREWERSYELRTTRVAMAARTGPRQTTLVSSVVRRQKK